MRTLFVTISPPWPETTGAAMRAATTVRGLAFVGDVDIFAISHDDGRIELGDLPVGRAWTVPFPAGRAESAITKLLRRVRAQIIADTPLELSAADTGLSRRRFAQHLTDAGRYDVIWFEHVAAWAWFHDLVREPTVVDIDDLDGGDRESVLTIGGATRWARLRARRRIAGWKRVQRRAIRSATLVAVASEEDRIRSKASNAVVIPNAYPTRPARYEGAPDDGHPIALFVGYLHYAPNADAVRTLALDVTPRLRELVPDVEVRIVGDAPSKLVRELSSPGITFTGRVPGVEDELGRASVTILPIRFGAGTRVKALEAFACGVPVVATSVALYGLDVQAGRHALVADDAEGLARGAANVLNDPELAQRLSVNGRELHQRRYSSTVVENLVASVAKQASGLS